MPRYEPNFSSSSEQHTTHWLFCMNPAWSWDVRRRILWCTVIEVIGIMQTLSTVTVESHEMVDVVKKVRKELSNDGVTWTWPTCSWGDITERIVTEQISFTCHFSGLSSYLTEGLCCVRVSCEEIQVRLRAGGELPASAGISSPAGTVASSPGERQERDQLISSLYIKTVSAPTHSSSQLFLLVS